MSVSLSLTVLLLMHEKSSVLVTSFPGPYQLHPSLPRDPSAHQGLCPTLGLATVLFRQLSFLLTPMSSLCVRNIFYAWLTVVTLLYPPSANISLTSLILCLYFFPFLPVWVLPSIHDLCSYPTVSLKPSLICQARVFFLSRTLEAAWLSGLLL